MITPPLRALIVAAAVLATLPLAPACRADAAVKPAHRDGPFTPAKVDKLTLVLTGDTSEPVGDMLRLREAIRVEPKDLIVVAGDLVHPVGPECPKGVVEGEALTVMDRHVGATFKGLGAPVLLAFGNHDIPYDTPESAAEACFIDYAAKHDDLVMPAATYLVDYGVAVLAVTNTVHLTDADGQAIASAFSAHAGWKLAFGHHALRTYRDKDGQDVVFPWLRRHGIAPDLWGNGHAHLMQIGVYDGVIAVTSGAAARRRERESCPPKCGAGERFGTSEVGYAVIEVTGEALTVTLKDVHGKALHVLKRERDPALAAPTGTTAPADPPTAPAVAP